jgi:Xaa-Pro aminopeptidase
MPAPTATLAAITQSLRTLGWHERSELIVVDDASSDLTADLARRAGARVLRGEDPCALPRACKNAVEIEGTRRAHIRDGAAVTRFLHWIATEGQINPPDEKEAVAKLEGFREETGFLKDLSFDTIGAANGHGALPHYRPTERSNERCAPGSLLLVDSGGQYLDGTTDITRTMAIGAPSAEMKQRYTLVLKGHLFLSRVRFPAGTTGSALDALARVALWNAGLDYDHGTGHGVGVYLGVHEGPQRIAKAPNSIALRPGMILSNEPGYYKAGEYGIRIENLQVVTEAAQIPGGERAMLGFETLTFAPIDRACIEVDLLTDEGMCLGGSSGINIAGAIRMARDMGPGHTIVTILCDYGNRYQSKLFNPAFLKEKGLPVPQWLDTAPRVIPAVFEDA